MADTFDPYLEWLEVRVANRPPSHYQLLGLDEFSDDPRKILAAADAMLARVRSFRPGPHLKQWQQVLDELLTAKLCLTDRSRRQQYDEQLRVRTANASADISTTTEPARPDPDLLPPSAMPLARPTPDREPPPAQPASTWPVQPAPAAMPVVRPIQPLATPVRAVPVAPPAAHDGFRTMMGPSSLAPLARPMAPAIDVSRPAAPMQAYPAALAPGQAVVVPPAAVPTVVPLAPVTPVTPQANKPADDVVAFRNLLDSTVFEPLPNPADPVGTSSPSGRSTASADAPQPVAQPLSLSLGSRPLVTPSEPALSTYVAPPRARTSNNNPALMAGGAAAVALLVVIGLVVGSKSRRASHPRELAVDQPADSSPVSSGDSLSAPASSDNQHNFHGRKRPKPVVDEVSAEESPDEGGSKEPPDEPAKETRVETPPMPDPRPVAPEKAPLDAQKSAALRKAIAGARGALAARDVARAKQELVDAEKLAQSDDDHHDLDRMRALAGYVEGFWKAVRDALKGLQVADELTVGNTVVAVVSTEDDSLVLHAGGSNREYTLKTLPAGLAMTLARRWFNKDAANMVFLGAFQAVDPNGDVNEARRLWEQATAGGASAADLMPLLTPGAASLPTELEDLPSTSAAADAQRRLKLSWRKEYQLAKSPALKVELAEKLLSAASTSQDPLERYAMFREALELGSTAADPPSILAAVDQMAHWYKIDALELTADALAKAGGAVNNPQSAKNVTQSALKLLDQALAAKQIKPAGKLSQAAVAAARKSRDAELVRTVNQRQQEVQELFK